MTKAKNKIIELSLSKNYVCNWGLWEAVREILQNAQDSEKDGNKLKITYHEADETLIITNEGTNLDISSLVLGNGTKLDDETKIGKYGEGYKLALLVLLREGKSVKICQDKEDWYPLFKKSKTFGTEVLAIEREKKEGSTTKTFVSFIIGDIKDNEFRRLQKLGLRIGKETGMYIGKTVECEYGEILLDDKFKGKFYVEGLFIQTDDNFKYGYSFNNDVVDLDRDRKAINYYDLCELTTKSLLSQTNDFEIVETSIKSETHDSKDLQYFYTDASDDFKEGFAEHYIEKHKLTKDTFVGTEKEVQLSDAKETKIVDEITAKWVNDGLGRGKEYQEIKQMAKDKNNKEAAYKIYDKSEQKKLFDWLLTNKKRISKKQSIIFINIVRGMFPSGAGIIRNEVLDNILSELNINIDELDIQD